MSRKLPQVRDEWLLTPLANGCAIRLDSAAWFAWLEAPETRSFAYGLFDRQRGYSVGLMTVRKERRKRGGWYWSVFRRQGQRLRRFYVGTSNQVTAARLASIAQSLLQETSDCAMEP